MIVYVAEAVPTAPGTKVLGVTVIGANPNNGSFTTTPVKVTFPVFSTSKA